MTGNTGKNRLAGSLPEPVTHRLARTGTGKPDQLRFALASTS